MNDIMKQAWAIKHMPATVTLYDHGVTEDMLEGFLYLGGHEEALLAYYNKVLPNFETEWVFEVGQDEVIYKCNFVVKFREGTKVVKVLILKSKGIWQVLFDANLTTMVESAEVHKSYPKAD